ncbi:MAG TPA: hypothetical protein PK025_09155 [Spirochaetales bacterium]|nr:hypothetical protein [Spirochaetales bacterium]HPD81202.1 hypothetical protein [Spirochaetales bacterium]
MKRVALLVVFSIVLGVGSFAFTQDLSPWQAGAYVQMASSIFFSHLAFDTFGLISGELLRFGAGVKTFIGLNYNAIFLAPYVRAEFGWFYMGAGPLFLLKQPEDPSIVNIENSISFLLFNGVAITVWKHDYGRLVFTLGLDASITPNPYISINTGDFARDILFAILIYPIAFISHAIKLNAGLGYYQYF